MVWILNGFKPEPKSKPINIIFLPPNIFLFSRSISMGVQNPPWPASLELADEPPVIIDHTPLQVLAVEPPTDGKTSRENRRPMIDHFCVCESWVEEQQHRRSSPSNIIWQPPTKKNKKKILDWWTVAIALAKREQTVRKTKPYPKTKNIDHSWFYTWELCIVVVVADW